MSIAAGLTATKATLDIAKILMDKVSGPNIDVHEVRASVQEMLIHVVNAQIALGEVQSALHAAEDDNRKLRRELEALRETRAITESLFFASEVYLKRKPDSTVDGPFCPACWDVDGKLVRLKLDGIEEYGGYPYGIGSVCRKYDCIVHHITYFIPEEKFNNVNIS